MNILSYFDIKRNELLTGVLLFVFTFLLVMGIRNARLYNDSAILVPAEVRLVLEDRTDMNGLIQLMKDSGIVFSEPNFRWSARLLGWRFFRKGSYEFSGGYTYDSFLSKLAKGLQDPVQVVVLPGIDQKRFALNVSCQIEATELAILNALTDSLNVDRYGFEGQPLFGRMLPDTYLVYWTIEPNEFIGYILKEFNKRVTTQLKAPLDSLNMSVDELITMASIVEWEAKIEREKPIIAGLYWNRMDRRMYLQADPTVNFALGERRRLLFEDYKLDHPYNTYMKRGLPPGPITNPSLSTIKATLFYQDHDYLYMVANPEGGHVFTRTFSEHQRESEKWRKWLREQYRIKRRVEREQQAGSEG